MISYQWVQQSPLLSPSSYYPTATEPLLLTRSHCLKITRDGVMVCFNLILSLLSVIYSHRRMGIYAGFHIANVDPDRLYVRLVILLAAWWLNIAYPDDSAAHISEETANAARAAPLAILVSVAFTSIMGWLLLISISFAIPSVSDLLGTDLPLQLGQVFLNVLGKRGMLAIWSMIIVVQVGDTFTLFKHHVYLTLVST